MASLPQTPANPMPNIAPGDILGWQNMDGVTVTGVVVEHHAESDTFLLNCGGNQATELPRHAIRSITRNDAYVWLDLETPHVIQDPRCRQGGAAC